MLMLNEPFLSAEVAYRRERALQAMAGRRPVSRPRSRRRSRARARTMAHRLVPGF